MLALIWLATALGADYYLETPYVADRTEVVQLEQAVRKQGQPGRVVRRFVDEQGWRFLVRMEGYETRADADRVAATLADELNLGIDILVTDGDRAEYLRRHDPGQEVPEPAPPVDPALNQAAWAVLERSAEAHGVDRDSLTRWMEGPSHLEFRRSLADGTIVDHGWYTREGTTYATTKAVEGRARSSRLFVRGEEAWLAVGEGDWRAQSAERAAVVVGDLSPPAVIPMVFALRHAMETRRELAYMEYAGTGNVGGEPTHVLGFGGDFETPALVLEVGQADALLRRVSFSGGELVVEFADHRTVGDLVLPHRVITRRAQGGADTVEVAVLRTGEEALDGAFAIADPTASPPP